MAASRETVVGRVVGIWRYPVKSMMGEELNASVVTDRGLLGDRAFALVDVETGKVASAKNPRRWPTLFDFRAAYVEPPSGDRPLPPRAVCCFKLGRLGAGRLAVILGLTANRLAQCETANGPALPPVRVTLPNGETLTTDQADTESRLTSAVGRPARLARTSANVAMAEGYWPDYDWLAQRDEVFEFPLPQGTFFDCALVHLVTTATLDRLRALFPGSRFEVPRFRPNLVIETSGGTDGFVENGWVGQTLTLGDVLLRVDGLCPRCIMTTLSQGTLPKDPSVLRAAVQENGGNVGVYASVLRGGRISRGDCVQLI